MRVSRAIILGLCLATAAWAQEAGLPAVGDSYEQVISRMGKPVSVIELGTMRLLIYTNAKVKVRDGVVAAVTPVEALAEATPTPEPASAAPAADGPPTLVLASDDVRREIRRFESDIAAKFNDEKFAELDASADKCVAEKAKFDNGYWKISYFDARIYLPRSDPEEKWAAQEEKIQRWEKANPDSIEARVIHVHFLTDYAWKARGSGWAKDVDQNAWQLFSNRLDQAYIVYQGARSMAKKSPMLWEAGSKIALGQGWSVEDMMKHYEEARTAEPLFPGYGAAAASFLLPRWYGAPGDWEKFALDESLRGDGLGTEGYAMTVVAMADYYPGEFFKNTKVEWPRLKEGLHSLILKYPRSKWWLNQYARFSVQAADREDARWAFEAMNGKADEAVWDLKTVREFQEWTYWHP